MRDKFYSIKKPILLRWAEFTPRRGLELISTILIIKDVSAPPSPHKQLLLPFLRTLRSLPKEFRAFLAFPKTSILYSPPPSTSTIKPKQISPKPPKPPTKRRKPTPTYFTKYLIPTTLFISFSMVVVSFMP